jgi:uncharacterized protein YecE (DUF72 family)
MVWSVLDGLQTPPIVTTDFLYLRFIGDRSIQEKDFGRIQMDRVVGMQKWADNIKAVKNQSDSQVKNERIKLAIVAANNHFAGFGPGTANLFRKMLGLPEAKWQEKEEEQLDQYQPHDIKQRSLSDFLS